MIRRIGRGTPFPFLTQPALRVPAGQLLLVHRHLELSHLQPGVVQFRFQLLLLTEHALPKIHMLRPDVSMNHSIHHENAHIDRAEIRWFKIEADRLHNGETFVAGGPDRCRSHAPRRE